MSYRHRHHHCDHGGSGCLVIAFVLLGLALYALPVFGLVLCFSKNEDDKILGWIFIVIGIALWLFALANS